MNIKLTITPINRSTEASWHADYRDTAYVYIGGLPFDLSEGDILTIFSQFGEPVHLNLVRDKETGKSRGFAFLKYEDQRSTDLAVDNLGGATVMGRMLRVDHVRYKRREEEGTEDNIAALNNVAEDTDGHTGKRRDGERRGAKRRSSDSGGETETEGGDRTRRSRRPQLKEELELNRLIEEHDDEDPMKQYLIQEKREEVQAALLAVEKPKKSRRRDRSAEGRDRHRHRHHHRRRHSRERSKSRERRSGHRGKPRSPSRSPPAEKRHHRSRRDRSR